MPFSPAFIREMSYLFEITRKEGDTEGRNVTRGRKVKKKVTRKRWKVENEGREIQGRNEVRSEGREHTKEDRKGRLL
jgi:hypothetical protein